MEVFFIKEEFFINYREILIDIIYFFYEIMIFSYKNKKKIKKNLNHFSFFF